MNIISFIHTLLLPPPPRPQLSHNLPFPSAILAAEATGMAGL